MTVKEKADALEKPKKDTIAINQKMTIKTKLILGDNEASVKDEDDDDDDDWDDEDD